MLFRSITALLIIPAAAARHFSGSPEAMAVIASCLGIGAVIAGLFTSAHFDTPSGPSIIVAAGLLLLVMRLASQLFSNQATPPHTDGETR